MQKVVAQNRRTLDMLAAKCYYYYARAYELTRQVDRIRMLDCVLAKINFHNLCQKYGKLFCFTDFCTVVCALALCVRTLKDKLLFSTSFCATISSTISSTKLTNSLQSPTSRKVPLTTKWLAGFTTSVHPTKPHSLLHKFFLHFNFLKIFFSGRIKAIQLEYSEAYKNLLQASRKAPQHAAIGFKQTVRLQ